MSSKYKRNALPNTYIPVLSSSTFVNILMRLPRSTVVELCNKWPQIVNTQPHASKSKLNQRQLNKLVMQESDSFRTDKTPKRTIVEKMVGQYWGNGLNLLQLSQIDCQLLVDKPNAYSWVSSTVTDSMGNHAQYSLDPRGFLELLSRDLCTFFMSHIYVCRHPQLPLIILRIQLFDLQPASAARTSNRPHIISNRAHFVAFPMGSAHIIHTPGNDLVTKIIMQVVERCLPQNRSNLLKVETDPKQKPVKSLESMHILYGNSRFGQSLGAWAAYADDTVDMSPLGKVEEHPFVKRRGSIPDNADDKENEVTVGAKKVKVAANIRFKGSEDGSLKSSRLYEEPLSTSRRSNRVSHEGDAEDEAEDEDGASKSSATPTSFFKSIAPLQYAEFKLQEKYEDYPEFKNNHQQVSGGSETGSDEDMCSITIKLAGADVFGGLHDLAASETDTAKMIVNPFTMPSWLTGEEGRSCGTVKKGIFYHN